MSHIEIVPIDAVFGDALRRRLLDRGHTVRMRTTHPETHAAPRAPAPREPLDAVVVTTGQHPLVRTNASELVARCGSAGMNSHAPPQVLSAVVDPTSDALEVLYAGGFDAILGAGAQRDLERHIEAISRLGRRRRSQLETPRRAPSGAAAAPSVSDATSADPAKHDQAVMAAHVSDALAQRHAARHWWSLKSIDDADLRAETQRLAKLDSPVLVRGELGAGRRHIARVMHELSGRGGGFVEVAAERLSVDPEELRGRLGALVALARHGTLCVTNAVALREDRVQVLRDAIAHSTRTRLVFTAEPDARPALGWAFDRGVLDVSPLRERKSALADLVDRFAPVEVDGRALSALQSYPWPGNVEELAEVVRESAERAGSAGELRLEHLPTRISAAFVAQDELIPRAIVPAVPKEHEWRITEKDPIAFAVYERKLLLRALAECGGNRARAAKLLGLGKSTLYRKLRELDGAAQVNDHQDISARPAKG